VEKEQDVIGSVAREAAELIEGQRASYGDYEDQFTYLAELISAYLRYPVSAKECAMIMVLVKLSRDKVGKYNKDNFRDAIGYLALADGLSAK
jgi:hypothetical protein